MAKKQMIDKMELKEWLLSLKDFTLPKLDDFPTLDLYMDQVITYITSKLTPLLDKEDFLTPSMINNYVKGKVVNSPNAKKYNKVTIAQLFFINLMKQILSIAEIKDILDKEFIEHYNELVTFEESIINKNVSYLLNETNLDDKQKLYHLALNLAIEAEVKKLIAHKILENL
ncbi:MAG: DUF1836 domain-containing protein [Bacilli bacterium]|nr:DUF1836 domain-containing protein [Bacilli bacterium]